MTQQGGDDSRAEPAFISSRGNAQIKALRKLAQDPGAYRAMGQVWLEGDHLCRAARDSGRVPALAVFAESAWRTGRGEWGGFAARTLVVPDVLFDGLSSLGSPSRMAFAVPLPATPPLSAQAPSVVLDRVQDAGNVGSILRSAAAFGFGQVLALKGTAALWSPKVLRAGMGAHFGLHLLEGLTPEDLGELQVPWLATSSHTGELLHRTALPWPCAWLLGHEGQGISPELERGAALRIRIAQPGGEESLNVAAAAAICLHASAASR